MYDFLNVVLLIMIAGMILHKSSQFWQGGKIKMRSVTSGNKPFFALPLIVCSISVCCWYWARIIQPINIIEACSGLFFLYGVLGLYLPKTPWKKSIIPFGLLLMTLPFGNIMDIYLGFPLRMAAVDLVSSCLQTMGISNISQSTIILMENKATQVDFSCSGLKGLWTGLIFFFSLSWLEQLKIGGRWLIGLALLIASLLAANLMRILILTILSSSSELQQIAEIIHVPLGIVGFILSCLLIYFLLKLGFFPSHSLEFHTLQRAQKTDNNSESKNSPPTFWKPIVVRASLLLLIGLLAFTPGPVESKSVEAMHFPFPSEWQVEKDTIAKLEAAFFEEQGSTASKFKFRHGETEGILLFIKTKGWRGHHHPEYCIQAGGHRIGDISTKQITGDFPVKIMEVNGNSSAYYWFQNPRICTDDFSTRVWAEMYQQEKDWVQISLVLNHTSAQETEAIVPLLQSIKELVQSQFSLSSKKQNP